MTVEVYGVLQRKLCSSYSYLFCVLEMDNSTVDVDLKAGVEVIKDKNGVDQVLLQNCRGASARVSFLNLHIPKPVSLRSMLSCLMRLLFLLR